ncbi:unnamed protein product [Camellia sinensis]
MLDSKRVNPTIGVEEREGPITAPVNFGNLVVMGIPRGAFRRIMEDRLEQSNEGERELYYVFESGVVENVGVHVVYKEAEEQALSSIYYNSEEDDQRRPPQQPQQQKA